MKKGFTLVELLAVIIILALLALIATPIIIDVINDSKDSVAYTETQRIVDGITEYCKITAMKKQMGTLSQDDVDCTLAVTKDDVKKMLDLKNAEINSIKYNNDKVQSIVVESNGRTIVYDGKDYKKKDGSVFKPLILKDNFATHKGVVYLDPTDLSVECDASNSTSEPGTKTGCMKFYVYDDSGDTYKMILDHNTTARGISWDFNANGSGPETLNNQLSSDTEGWVGESTMISVDELMAITGATVFDPDPTTGMANFAFDGPTHREQVSFAKGESKFAWLFDYLIMCESYGCNYELSFDNQEHLAYGYFTSTKYTALQYGVDVAYAVYFNGCEQYVDQGIDAYMGIRPVLVLPKSALDVVEDTTPLPVYVPPTSPTIVLSENKTYKGIAYLDPTDLTKGCDEVNSVSTTGTKTGCMKFYIYNDSNDTYKMILDHNTTALVPWNSTGVNSEMKEVTQQLAIDTTGWAGSPRLLSDAEIEIMFNNLNYDQHNSSYDIGEPAGSANRSGTSEYTWMFSYTNDCYRYGCSYDDTSTQGYWTSGKETDTTDKAYAVSYDGKMTSIDTNSTDFAGVRPVITLLKSQLNPDYVPEEPVDNTPTYKGIVYLDPTNLSAKCDATNFVSTLGKKEGCMKFYIFDDSGDTYKMILDHNTTSSVGWNTSRSNTAMREITTVLEYDTEDWVGNPRLITADEIAAITNNENFDGKSSTRYYFDTNGSSKVASERGSSRYAWLYDGTHNCDIVNGCNISDQIDDNFAYTSGYWTSSAVTNTTDKAWVVTKYGSLGTNAVYELNSHGNYGVRPVITLTKTQVAALANNVDPDPVTATKATVVFTPGRKYKGIAYLDPTNIAKACDASNVVSTTGTKTGCMKFYIFNDSGNKYKMILDHNTTANTIYSSSSTLETKEIYNQLAIDTEGWLGNPRLITAYEVATITNNTSFDSSISKVHYFGRKGNVLTYLPGTSRYAWLFDYTKGCTNRGCSIADEDVNGYWTDTQVFGKSNVWYVSWAGSLYYIPASRTNEAGIRPVIELEKSLFN